MNDPPQINSEPAIAIAQSELVFDHKRTEHSAIVDAHYGGWIVILKRSPSISMMSVAAVALLLAIGLGHCL